MTTIKSIKTTATPSFEQQRWTRAIIRSHRPDVRPNRDYIVTGTWDIENFARGETNLYICPVGHDDYSDFYGVAVLPRAELDEFDRGSYSDRIRIMEAAVRRAIEDIEERS